MTTTCILILILAISGSFIQRVSGFGFGIFVMMFLPFFIPTFGEAITLSGLLAGTTSLIVAIRNWKYIRWKIMGIILTANVITSFIAIGFMADLGNDIMKKCLGAVLIIISLYSIFFQGKHKIPQSRTMEALIGAISGITGGMFAMPGPPIVLYCIGTFQDKREYIATLQALFCCSNIFYTLFRANAGFFTSNTLSFWAIGLAGVLIGTILGAKCFEHISGATLKKIVYIMMIVSGVVAIL